MSVKETISGLFLLFFCTNIFILRTLSQLGGKKTFEFHSELKKSYNIASVLYYTGLINAKTTSISHAEEP
jgi:hypothetical protein